MAQRQREISVSEFFLKNRHLLGFDSPRRALLTAVKEAVDNALDACEEARILPEIAVDVAQTSPARFRVEVTDNGPGIVRAQIPKIFAKLLYGSKFHRLRMSRGQQGIGISAAGMYGQLTTGQSTRILSRTAKSKAAHSMEVQIDTRANKPVILRDEETGWAPAFPNPDKPADPPVPAGHGTSVSIEMEAAYVRGRLSVDEFLQQCAIVNPHLQLHYRVTLLAKEEKDQQPTSNNQQPTTNSQQPTAHGGGGGTWQTYRRAVKELPPPPGEIQPHPHGVELGVLMQMLKDTSSRTLRGALATDFSRVSDRTALEICTRAGLEPKANPTRIAHRESEALFKAIAETKLMRPPTDCLSPIGEAAIVAGLKKEIQADFYTAITRDPAVYRGNPFVIEAGLACSKPGENEEQAADDPVRVLRFANRVPLLYQAGACAVTKAVTGVNWKAYGLSQPKGALPVGPVVLMLHMASVWVPFTSESKDAIASYAEILREATFALQECGRRLSVFLSRRHREAEAMRKRDYIQLYIPHLALGLKGVLGLSDREEADVKRRLAKMLERTHLDL
ncbi:MAG: DNA topoisomerase VI subunit B [Lentisphaerae bacterium]|nr:DNA topoisomerase VI subunit B [Lentisphaerota bacterium]